MFDSNSGAIPVGSSGRSVHPLVHWRELAKIALLILYDSFRLCVKEPFVTAVDAPVYMVLQTSCGVWFTLVVASSTALFVCLVSFVLAL